MGLSILAVLDEHHGKAAGTHRPVRFLFCSEGPAAALLSALMPPAPTAFAFPAGRAAPTRAEAAWPPLSAFSFRFVCTRMS